MYRLLERFRSTRGHVSAAHDAKKKKKERSPWRPLCKQGCNFFCVIEAASRQFLYAKKQTVVSGLQ